MVIDEGSQRERASARYEERTRDFPFSFVRSLAERKQGEGIQGKGKNEGQGTFGDTCDGSRTLYRLYMFHKCFNSVFICAFIYRYFFAVLAILTLLGILNGLVLLPVLLSLMGPPAEVVPANNANQLQSPSPEPMPPPMNHHGYYTGHIPKAPRQAFSETSESEYYSETTTTSGIGEEEYKYCDRSTYITPPAQPPTSHILLEASKNPSFPKLTVS